MPNMDGITFVKEVKKLASYKFTPIIMLTTESQESKKLEGQAAGAKAWVVKPFQPAQMLAAVSKLILPRFAESEMPLLYETQDDTAQVQIDGELTIYRSEEHTSELQSLMRK